MNILVASSRQYSPEQEWIFLGVRNLMEDSYGKRFNWALYDRNPDLLNLKGPRTHRPRLNGNSFRHQTLLPFTAVVLAGTSHWQGEEMEKFYGTLSKHPLPVFGFGLEAPQSAALSETESLCLARAENLITAKDESSLKNLKTLDLNAILMPCPSLFAARETFTIQPATLGRSSRIAVVLQDSQRPDAHLSEATVRQLCQAIAKLSKVAPVDVVCPTIDDFMRFSTMFPDLVRYSYDAGEYLDLLRHTDLVITGSPSFATLANSLLKPALFLSEQPEQENLHHLPYIYPVALNAIREKAEAVLGDVELCRQIRHWKDGMKCRWQELLETKQHVLDDHELAKAA